MQKSLSTDEYSLLIPAEEHLAQVAEMLSDPKTMEFLPHRMLNADNAPAKLAQQFAQTQSEVSTNPKEMWWLVQRKSDAAIVGLIGFVHLQISQRKGEIGCILHHPYWGNEIFLKVVSKLINFGFEDLGLARVEFYTFIENEKAHRIMAKLGARQEGVLRDSFWDGDRLRTDCIYSILRSDWENHDEPVAIVHSGGGAKGCFGVGVLEQLICEQKIRPQAVYGTSVGAIAAFAMASIGVEEYKRKWLEIEKRSDIMRLDWKSILSLGLFTKGLFRMDPLENRLRNSWEQRGEELLCKAIVSRVSLVTGGIEFIDSEHPDFIPAVLASASSPLVNPPVGEYVDGGVIVQTPITRAIRDGYRKIICIICNPWDELPANWKMPKFFPIPKYIVRIANDIMCQRVFVNNLRTTIRLNNHFDFPNVDLQIYMPDHKIIETYEFDPQKIREGIEAGSKARPVPATQFIS